MNQFISLISFALILSLTSCGSNTPEESSTIQKEIAPLPAFQNFPEIQFDQFKLGMTTTTDDVNKNVYVLTSPGEPSHYINFKDSTIIILPNNQLDHFTVFLRSQDYLRKDTELIYYFDKTSDDHNHNKSFHSFTFHLDHNDFKMTYFKQEDFIRLYFKALTPHS